MVEKPDRAKSVQHHDGEKAKGPEEPDLDTAFSDWYLRQVTKDYAEDIERLRNASDFKDVQGPTSSVDMLVHTLTQGAETFTREEKRQALDSSE